jgi:predicted RND superfamily exporter protein
MARRWPVLILAALLGVLGARRTVLTYGALRSDLEELLPESAPTVHALDVLRSRLPGVRYMGVVVDTGGPHNVPAANRFLDDLAQKLASYPKDMVGIVRTGVSEERRFAETFALQLMDVEDLEKLRVAVERRRDWEVTRATGTDILDESEDPKPEIPIAELRKKYQDRYGRSRTFPQDRFVSADGKTALLILQATTHSTGIETDRALLTRIKADVAGLGFPDRYAAGMRVGFSSDVPTRVEEMEGLMSDLSVSGVLVIALVLGSLVVFFRSWRALPILGVPLTWGTVYTFGLVALPPLSIRHLNSNTAFLGSIIVGNGINSGIIVLARFQEERRRGAPLELAVQTALSTSWRPTLAAAAAATAAYGSLIFTDFRGFSGFGWIGGIGMLVCWAATMLLLPAMLGVMGEGMTRAKPGRAGDGGLLSRGILALFGRPQPVLIVTTFGSALALAGLFRRHGDWIEYDLSKLRMRSSAVSGAQYWDARQDATLERYLDPTVILTEDAAQATLVAERARRLAEQGAAGDLIDSVRSARDVLPPDRPAALEEIRLLKKLLTPRMKAELEPEDRRMVEQALSERALTPLTPQDLPETIVAGLREHDGRIDRSVLVFPKLQAGTWDAERLRNYTRDLRAAATVDGRALAVAGPLLLSSDIAAALETDGPRATALSLLVVLVICAVAFRSLRLSLAAVASLLVGVLLMLGTLAWSGAKLNFSNFVALPITFGIAADYSINMLKRFQSEGQIDLRSALASTGGAVALCSFTTVVGYGSLLLAQNRALFSFGVMAVAGEVACLATAIVALPSALTLMAPRRSGALPAR